MIVCISWVIKNLIVLMHGATMKTPLLVEQEVVGLDSFA
jgi:hypothetical protein